jgi:hypothetical protein
MAIKSNTCEAKHGTCKARAKNTPAISGQAAHGSRNGSRDPGHSSKARPAARSASPCRSALLCLSLKGGLIGAVAPIKPSQRPARLCAAILDRRDTVPAPPFSTAVNTSLGMPPITPWPTCSTPTPPRRGKSSRRLSDISGSSSDSSSCGSGPRQPAWPTRICLKAWRSGTESGGIATGLAAAFGAAGC